MSLTSKAVQRAQAALAAEQGEVACLRAVVALRDIEIGELKAALAAVYLEQGILEE